MNAGAALYIGGKAETMKEGIALAAEIIDSGKALKTLEKFIDVSNQENDLENSQQNNCESNQESSTENDQKSNLESNCRSNCINSSKEA